MDDLISRETVLEFEEYVGERATWDKPYPKGDLYVKSEIIERIPSAEPEIIRCKDCYWWIREKLEGFELSYGDCESPDIWDCIRGNAYDVIAFQTNEDFYCRFAMTEVQEVES